MPDDATYGLSRRDAEGVVRLIDHNAGGLLTDPQPSPFVAIIIGYTAGGATARSGTTVGSGTMTYQSITTTTIGNWTTPAATTKTETFYNLSTSAVSAGYIVCARDSITGKLIALWEDC